MSKTVNLFAVLLSILILIAIVLVILGLYLTMTQNMNDQDNTRKYQCMPSDINRPYYTDYKFFCNRIISINNESQERGEQVKKEK